MTPAARLALLVLCGAGTVPATTETGPAGPEERVARWVSAGFREGEKRLGEIATELAGLPSLAPQPFASRYGFRSASLLDPDDPQWLQVDLGKRRRIDRIVAVPVHIPVLGERGKGYGFPQRFRIEVADDPEMQVATTVIDRTRADVPNPGCQPEDFPIKPIEGRYVRFTSTRHFPVEDGFIWALEELLVLSGNRSLAVWQPVEASSRHDRYPNWSPLRVIDAQSALSLPVTTEPSPTRGYLSAPSEDPEKPKWLRIDFGRPREIDEIRLVAAEERGFEVLRSGAFPRTWKVELAEDPDFTEVVWSYQQARTNLTGFPGHCAVVVPTRGKSARYLRFVTIALWGEEGQHDYGIAEIQAYSGDENVALGQPVAASDQVEAGPDHGWDPAFVTDGFSSRHPLIEIPEHLDLIARRGRLEKERDQLLEQRARALQTTRLSLGYGGGTLGGLALLGWGWMAVRQRKIRRRAVARLREQIARDLHDDIGTNLGGIVLVSEIGSRHSEDARAREDFHTIKEAAEQTAQSMQDIVWLIERGNTRLRDLVSRLRETTELVLGDAAPPLAVEPPDFRDRRLSLFFRRHFFFAFKEALHNARRHARARTIEARVVIDRRTLGFEVRDDGIGFDPDKVSPDGHGLANLRRRAERLRGSLRVESRPGGGTWIHFQAPMHSKR